ncbi:intraflagellar transport protein 56-like isoform X2 [Brachyhypopomus gauderio]|uniref:intraflagellar transport protein 56-like isoform X2 n=1 Tax=Brachyhypopomus gauderio TaxID=698409 RepID=UPI00404191BB
MILSRVKPAVECPPVSKKTVEISEVLEDYLSQRDYVGAITLLEFQRSLGQTGEDADLWLAYCAFHLGDYSRALKEYKAMTEKPDCKADVWVYLACTLFFLGLYKEAQQAALKGSKCELQNRLLLHLAHKLNDEQKVLELHRDLQDVIEDQLSLASIHYMRAHYSDAIAIYKRVLCESRSWGTRDHQSESGDEESDYQHRQVLALHVYVALCYFKLDYYDVSQQVLDIYLHSFPDSISALNLKACISFSLGLGGTAEVELKHLMDVCSSSTMFARELIKHNLVVFQDCRGAVQELTPLLHVIPEARLNLVIFYLRHGELQEAFNLLRDLEAIPPQVQGSIRMNIHQRTEYILKAATNTAMGQEVKTVEHLKIAQQFYHLVGSSDSECATVPGRQCMAACFFLLKQFQNVLIYLDSIKSYFINDDTFHFNYAQARAAVGDYREAEESFLQIQTEEMKTDGVFLNWLARCLFGLCLACACPVSGLCLACVCPVSGHVWPSPLTVIMNGKVCKAWELYLTLDPLVEDTFRLLELIANDCYKMGHFYISAMAFGVLEQLYPNPAYFAGKIGACVGVFQLVLARRESRQALRKVLSLLLENSRHKDVDKIISVVTKWANDHRIAL